MVNVLVPEGDASPAVRIPKTALKRDSFGTYVFSLINADEAGEEGMDTPAGAYRAKRLKVTLGAELGTEVVVSEGLQAQRFIAAKGAYKLREGMLVYVNSNTPDKSTKQGEQ
jgi:multidrug efflux pump subunit AcrA (membrane-fusion protein)